MSGRLTMLTGEQIAAAKRQVRYRYPDDILHEHDDCIRMCYEWLSAQRHTTSSHGRGVAGFRSLIMHWAGSYVSKDDVDVALVMLPRLIVTMHDSNLSRKLVLPKDSRLEGIGQVMRHPEQRTYLQRDIDRIYKAFE